MSSQESVEVTDVHGVLNIPLCVRHGNEDDIKRIILLIRPKWQYSDPVVKYMPGGSVNYIYICHRVDDPNKSDALIVRLFGGMEKTICRIKEKISMRIAHASGCAKPLYASFDNGVVYGFAVGRVPTWDDLWNPEIARPIMKSLACLNSYKDIDQHCVDMDGSNVEIERKPCFGSRMREWLQNYPTEFVNFPEREERFKREVKSRLELENEISKLQQHLESFNFPVVFCHNDVWVANFVYDKEKDINWLIDYEYAAFNYDGFDLGTFLSCFDFQDIIDKGTGPSQPLSRQLALQLTRFYLEARREYSGGTSGVTEEQLQKFFLQIRVLDIACRFYWGLAVLTLADNPDVKRIDPLHFAISRFTQYEEDRDELYNIKIPN